jgi:hypothetical protein
MDSISTSITMIIAVSLAVERVTEILKQMVPWLATELTDEGKERRRRAALQLLAAAIGTLIAFVGNLKLGSQTGPGTDVLVGLMASGGSGFWNHALDAVRALKINTEAAATEKQAASKQFVAAVHAQGARQPGV